MKKVNYLQKNLKFHCFKCQTIYQLIEVHNQVKQNCPDNCWKHWQTLCHDYYKEKMLAYLALQEEIRDKDLEKSANLLADWLKKTN